MTIMDHLAQDLSVALEESESCGPTSLQVTKRWGMRRRTRSAGNLHLCINKCLDHRTDESSSGDSENRSTEKMNSKYISSFHQTDSDDLSMNGAMARFSTKQNSTYFKGNVRSYFSLQRHNGNIRKSSFCGLESDSLNEHSPARPSIRRKRKLKRMCVDEVPVLPSGKRKRPQRVEPMVTDVSGSYPKIRPLNQSIVDKIEKFCQDGCLSDSVRAYSTSPMESSFLELNVCDAASESSLSWSGGEGHEGDDELTDWAPAPDPSPSAGDAWAIDGADSREIRAGCRRLRDERPGFSIATGANERIARFMQDVARNEMKVFEGERDALLRLANLYSLEYWEDGASIILRKTGRTPCMQPPQRHHTGFSTGHKRIRTHEARPT